MISIWKEGAAFFYRAVLKMNILPAADQNKRDFSSKLNKSESASVPVSGANSYTYTTLLDFTTALSVTTVYAGFAVFTKSPD